MLISQKMSISHLICIAYLEMSDFSGQVASVFFPRTENVSNLCVLLMDR